MREWGLIATAVIVTLLLTLGVMSFAVPSSSDSNERLDLSEVIRGLACLVLLFDLYVVHQQIRIARVRRRLFEREEVFHLIAENAAEMIALVDIDGRRLYNSPGYEKVLGYSREELLATSAYDQIHPDDRERVLQANEVARQNGTANPLEFRMRHKDGSWRIINSSAGTVLNAAGKAEKLVIVARDVTEQQMAQESLREAEARERFLIEQASDAIYVIDTQGNFREANPRTAQLLGYPLDEILRLNIRDVTPEQDRLASGLGNGEGGYGESTLLEGIYRKRDGTLVSVESNVKLISEDQILVIARDITERKRLEEQLRESRKMEAVGQLAGGVAHDFNNILMAITSYSELLLSGHLEDKQRNRVVEVLRAAERAAALTQRLLTFSRKQPVSPSLLEVNSWAQAIVPMLRSVVGDDIRVTLIPSCEPANVNVDQNQLEQVLINLATNARDAMPRGGRLDFEVTTIAVAAEPSELLHLRPGRYVRLAVTDTGCGMDSRTRSRIFEPFFTTKEVGKGTGLGLPMVLGIVHQNLGEVGVYSEPDRGTTVRVYLPEADAVAQTTQSSQPPTLMQAIHPASILLVEDVDQLRNAVKDHLEDKGYSVVAAGRPVDAIRLAAKGHFDLMLTDVVMPEMSGPVLYDTLSASHPEMDVLYMSGYTDRVSAEYGPKLQNKLLRKPFSLSMLDERIAQVLANKSATS
jgi:two-component system, cell cycle sensor histidine kinase and response regulator CckA